MGLCMGLCLVDISTFLYDLGKYFGCVSGKVFVFLLKQGDLNENYCFCKQNLGN